MLSITPIPAFSDNYIWCLANSDTGMALIVDPGQAEPVISHLESKGLSLDTILVTHHHPDHTGGIKSLASRFQDCRIVGPEGSPFKGVTETVKENDSVSWDSLTFDVIEVPGHTLDHIAFYCQQEVAGQPVLFCGDTLFISGCGRLSKLRALPDNTAVFCAHEYTLANLRFARHWLPGDENLAEFERHCQALRESGKPTVPGSIGEEKRLNPFLRWDDPMVKQSAQEYAAENRLGSASESDVFAATRHGKDNF